MVRKERPSLWAAWARWTTRHSRGILFGVLLCTLFFAFGLTRIEFGSQLLDLYSPESKALIKTIETDFQEGRYLTLIFESRDESQSLLEPKMLHQQFRVLEALKTRFPVDTFSLVGAIDEGLRRAKKVRLLDVSDYTTIAEGILALSGGRSVWDLEKVSRNFLSHPEAIGFYTRLRVARDVWPGAIPLQGSGGTPGAETTEFFPPTLQAMKALIQIKGPQEPEETGQMAIQIRDLARSFINEDLNIYALNGDLITAEIDVQTAQNLLLMALTVMLTVCLVFWAFFMRVKEVLIALVLMGTSLIWTFGLAGFIGYRLSFIHLMVVPILIGTGNDDAFVFGRQLLEKRQDTSDLPTAIEKTFTNLGKTIFLTTFTTFVAFGIAAGLADAEGIIIFNVLVAVSMITVFFLTILLQGPLRVWLGEQEGVKRKIHEQFLTWFLAMGTLSFRYVSQHRDRVLLVSLFVGLVGLWLSFGLQSEFSHRIFLRPSMQTTQADRAEEAHFGVATHGYLLIEGKVENPVLVKQLKQLEQTLVHYPVVQKVLRRIYVDSITELIDKLFIHLSPRTNMREVFERIATSPQTANFALNQTFEEAAVHRIRKKDDRYDGLLVKFIVTGGDGRKIRTFIDDMQHEMEKLGLYAHKNVSIRVGGGELVYFLEEGRIFKRFMTGFGLSLVLIFLILLILWRRVTLASMALVPLVLSLLITLGTMVLFGVKLNTLNLWIGAIVIGVGIDYPIHMIERYREAKKRRGVHSLAATQQTLQSTGPSICASALTTMVGFSACAILGMPVAVSFGLLMAWAIFWVYVFSISCLPALLSRYGNPRKSGVSVSFRSKKPL